MTDILELVSEQDKRTLTCLSKNDIESIWAEVSAYVERQLTVQRGVHLAGLGTFIFSQQKLDIGNKSIMIQRPIFILSGKLIHSLGVKQTKPLAAATHLPVVQLNFAAVSGETPFSRDTVESCVKETLLLLCRALASEKNIFLTFKGIGVLYFKKNKAQMKFNRDFINAMDGTGQLLLGFKKRPGSSVSLLSGGLSRLQRPQTANPITLPTVYSPQPDSKTVDKDVRSLSAAPEPRNAGEVPQQRECKSHQTLQPAKLKAVSLFEELNPNPPPMETTDKPTMINSSQVAPSNAVEHFMNMSCSGHTRAGQELCYLCMQRARRNVPVYMREQQQAEEKNQEKLLLLNEQLRDKQYMEEEQMKLTEQREHAKQVAAFNLQMSERKESTHGHIYPNSFIFPARPVTPPRRIQQNRYMNDLQSQIESRRKYETQDHQNRLIMERLDQVQLTQEIASQKIQQLQQKQEKTKHYKRALDTQVGDKKYTEPLESQPDRSMFTRCEAATSHTENRERAHKLFQVNISAATQRKKEELHNRQQQLKKEMDMLRHNKMELIIDRINRFEKMRDINKSLEDEWSRSVKVKHKREEEERRFLRSGGQLLVDKLAEYKRCCQCKRRTTNCGETNIWKESHYVSGSQFMI